MSFLRTQSSCISPRLACAGSASCDHADQCSIFVQCRFGLKIMVAQVVGLRCRRAYPGDEMHGTVGNPDMSRK